MNPHLIWITGRAATGKTTLISVLADLLRTHGRAPTVFSDEDILLQLVRADTGHQHHTHLNHDHRITWRTGQLFDDSLRMINTHLLKVIDHDGLTVVELARGRHVPPIDVTYRRALDLLDPRLWPHSIVVRLHTPFDLQLSRNFGRATGTGQGTPDEIMHALYADDDPDSFTTAGIPLVNLPGTQPPQTNAAQVMTLLNTH